MRNKKQYSLEELQAELERLQAELPFYDKFPAMLRRNEIADIESEIESRKPLPELSQRLRAWRAGRGLQAISKVLEVDFGQVVSPSMLSRIERGKLEGREDYNDFMGWLEKYLIAKADTYRFELNSPIPPVKNKNRWFG